MLFQQTALLALAGSGSAFVVDLWSGKDCTGQVQSHVNVWDNTCRDNNIDRLFRSYRAVAYGAHRQRADFYQEQTVNNCINGDYGFSTWADGGGDYFKKGNCYNLPYPGWFMGSRSA